MSENCHVTALKVNTRVLPMDLDTRVSVISQPASPHHDVDTRRLRLAPSWSSLKDNPHEVTVLLRDQEGILNISGSGQHKDCFQFTEADDQYLQ